MTDIVSDAREWLDGYAGRESTHSAKCHGWHDACLISRLVDEIERLRLTKEERQAIESAADFVDAKSYASADTIRGLLERTKSMKGEA